MIVVYPNHITNLPEENRSVAELRYLIRLAALHYSPGGTVGALSEALGLHTNTLAGSTSVTAEMAVKLEELLGQDRFPRSLFRPDLFTAGG